MKKESAVFAIPVLIINILISLWMLLGLYMFSGFIDESMKLLLIIFPVISVFILVLHIYYLKGKFNPKIFSKVAIFLFIFIAFWCNIVMGPLFLFLYFPTLVVAPIIWLKHK